MSAQRPTPVTEPGARRRDWTCWASALLIVLMLLTVLACGGVFLYQLSHRHQVVSHRDEAGAISSLHLVATRLGAHMYGNSATHS